MVTNPPRPSLMHRQWLGSAAAEVTLATCFLTDDADLVCLHDSQQHISQRLFLSSRSEPHWLFAQRIICSLSQLQTFELCSNFFLNSGCESVQYRCTFSNMSFSQKIMCSLPRRSECSLFVTNTNTYACNIYLIVSATRC